MEMQVWNDIFMKIYQQQQKQKEDEQDKIVITLKYPMIQICCDDIENLSNHSFYNELRFDKDGKLLLDYKYNI